MMAHAADARKQIRGPPAAPADRAVARPLATGGGGGRIAVGVLLVPAGPETGAAGPPGA